MVAITDDIFPGERSMEDSFTIELYEYILDDPRDDTHVQHTQAPSRWSRHWSDPTENLTSLYEHVLEVAKEWQARKNYHGSRIELITENERFCLVEFPPQLIPNLRTFVEDN